MTLIREIEVTILSAVLGVLLLEICRRTGHPILGTVMWLGVPGLIGFRIGFLKSRK